MSSANRGQAAGVGNPMKEEARQQESSPSSQDRHDESAEAEGTAASLAPGAGEWAQEVAQHYLEQQRLLQLSEDPTGEVEVAGLQDAEAQVARATFGEPGLFKRPGCRISWRSSKMPDFVQFNISLRSTWTSAVFYHHTFHAYDQIGTDSAVRGVASFRSKRY